MMPLVKAVTTEPNAAPITTATARSTTLPRRTKSLKPLITLAEGNGDLFGERGGCHPCRLPRCRADEHQPPGGSAVLRQHGQDRGVGGEHERLVGVRSDGDDVDA